ncbi:Protein of unknown function [Lactobacillus helveticus CIRM-BIA 101]|uniref:Uncharacterized protein n=2 Tax=Lactobacillus helveticus TaxID=1587 RepID=U6FBV0_LACHE|nr:Protein of unknown function [Lactobacillus helveticus CIRM-BIA 951]CDI60051.1 Protein of unknown function [Lactobacillus helveticus CIRM-BIA 104]CDI65738.1 Protein of unknown function [Lactobacillus helveticus CIRM-BIA 101]
MIWWELPVIIK